MQRRTTYVNQKVGEKGCRHTTKLSCSIGTVEKRERVIDKKFMCFFMLKHTYVV